MSNNLVAYSRAGDVFHYRWAARRCLKLVHPNTSLRTIVIEGSQEDEKEGEYVIDVAEYYEEPDRPQKIIYYQLKHTTVRNETPFGLSDLKGTIEGFAKRFSQHLKEVAQSDFTFAIVTNRPVENSCKQNIINLAKGQQVNDRFKETIQKYTELSPDELQAFCKCFHFLDGEGNYNGQKDELRIEIAQLIAGAVDNALIENIVALVQERVMPDSDGRICREDILRRFGISSEKDLLPASAMWEQTEHLIEREQHKKLKVNIANALHPVIVHAPGGVGKSVFCRQLIATLPSDSVGIVYDCFGAGSYRNRSEPRHQHRNALVQITNELAVKGLCDPLLVQDTSQDTDMMKKFLQRIDAAVRVLKQINDTAELFILIDAADNAEMAAQEYNHPCFVHELLRENIPQGCKLVMLCRTERIELLQPQSTILKLELEAFSEAETFVNLKGWFPEVDEKDGIELHRLTSGNPRVQAYALGAKAKSISELLSQLGPAGATVEKQIELQLNAAVSKIKDTLASSFQEQIQAICLGLASLPPHIPIGILAKAADVTTETIRSFVADIGRSLWLSDDSVQFRDEPTETWFRKTYLATRENFESYISILEPLANQYTYVAEVLPHLYLQAGQYKKQIEIAISDNYLPENNPIDARNVRVYRLQFAFRAALRSKQYDDAVKIAIRAGEEVAGSQRQFGLFQDNIDLFIALRDKQAVQDIAFKRLLRGHWQGSQNVYTASLLSGINEYKGEARGYLRAAVNWLQIYYDELSEDNEHIPKNEVTDGDILEIAYSFLNIYGIEHCIDFINRFKSKAFAFKIMQSLISRLIDRGLFDTVNSFLQSCNRQPYYMVAITGELVKIGRFPETGLIATCLELLTFSKSRIKKPQTYYYNDGITSAIVCFVEACLYRGLPSKSLLRVLRYYVSDRASQMVSSSHQSQERTIFLRAIAIRILLENKSEVDTDAILPQNLIGKKEDYDRDRDIKEFKEIINGLFPWYFLRVRILSRQEFDFKKEVTHANEKSNKARNNRHRSNDTLPNEIATLQSSIFLLHSQGSVDEINWFYNTYIKNNKALWLPDELNAIRAAYRLSHLSSIKQQLEHDVYERIKSTIEDGPEQIAERYINLARAVLNSAPDDAGVYFEEAVNIVSKFGDEIVRRWEAVISLAKQACTGNEMDDELAYRFIRCAETVGDYVTREKYWDRDEAIAVCARMSEGAGIAALSRWRDRDIGRFHYQLEALLIELLESHKISSPVGWALSRFFSNHQLEELLSICLKNEVNIEIKQKIFADAVYLLQIEGASSEFWKKMHQIASEQNIQHDALDEILGYYQRNPVLSEDEKKDAISGSENIVKEFPWEDVFGDLDILNPEQFDKCLNAFITISDKRYYRNFEDFWQEAIQRLNENDLWKFIDIVLLSELSHYEIRSFINLLPEKWKNKVSVKRNWPALIERLGKKYAQELTSPYTFNFFTKDLNFSTAEIDKLKEGVFEGLARGYEFSNAELFFGFVSMAIPTITSKSATQLLDFALSRFELHINQDFGDGEWSNWLVTPKPISKSIAGFIWSALGSPRSSERWNAAHSIRVLAEFNCVEVIDELINWMQHGKVDAFGHPQFPFYDLHAKQYLLIALARVAVDKPELLMRHRDLFVLDAFGNPHILIQKFSAEIAINIAAFSNNIDDKEILDKLKLVGSSNMPTTEIECNETVDSYWHVNKMVDTEYDFHFAWDFDNYWFEPLGDVFGIEGKQIEDIAADVVIKEWKAGDRNGYNSDPRVSLWSRYSGESETSHDDSSYPRTDNLDFYLSYHSVMVAAAKLLEKMPIVKISQSSDDDSWVEWLSRHLLTRPHGQWLADYRDPVPICRPMWIGRKEKDNWQNELTEVDFFDCLKSEINGAIWINVKGGWNEKENERTETFSIATALVSPQTSDALLRALQTCSDPQDYKLPYFGESRMEIESDMFQLKGWINDRYTSKELDEHDPYADKILYPPYALGDTIVECLGLIEDMDEKNWKLAHTSEKVLNCEAWNSHSERRDEESDQSGMRLKAKLSFLKSLCFTLGYDLIFEVSIKREINHRYGREKREYAKPQYKLFILSADGKLRTTGSSYELR